MNKIIMQNKNKIEASLLSNDEITKNTEYTLPNRSGTLPIIVPELKDEECIEVTVGPNGDFKELCDAVCEMSKFTLLDRIPRTNCVPRKVIRILPNYVMEKQLWCVGNNYGDIYINAEENEVLINREAIASGKILKVSHSFAFTLYNTISPVFSGKFTMMENGNMNLATGGMFYAFCSRLTINTSSILTGGFYGIYGTGASTINADKCKFIANNTTLQLVRTHGSYMDCNRSTFDISNVNGEQLYKVGIGGRKDFTSLFSSESGVVRAYSSTFIGNNYNSSNIPLVYSCLNSVIDVSNSKFNNHGHGLRVTHGGIMGIGPSYVFSNITTETNVPVNTVSGAGIIFKGYM
ncbi:hypothetical protein ACVWU4_000940 [Campylobacter coli]